MIQGMVRQLKVFLCHASGDKPQVRELYKRLIFEGVDAWLDQEKLLPGQDWRLEIPKEVHEADVVLICLSRNSITKEGYIQKEIKFALDIADEKPEGTIFLIPARLEDCTVPERLSRWHWVDLFDEDGFIKLMRSLKLRADAMGAVIEPTSYENTDNEREQRIKRIYTDGLAAFYTEEWDKACHCFQSILSEQPNHKIAAEKLEESQQQRALANLYALASEAVKKEDWQPAIRNLEELSQKSVNYKDAAQLLKNARRQEQLGELYAEAKALHEAQKWEAVVRVFGQVVGIDPNYEDTEGLLSSAQGKIAELQRLAELNDLYSRAVEEMDAGRWNEARQLLEKVHKSQTGFLETEKLLKKAEEEIAREEEKRRQNDQINTLYEQAHGLLRSKKWRNALGKMDEISKLDDHFSDTDGIAEKAQKELTREEQDADRQNKLAASYAESVKLLKEEKYQEALDKWLAVRAVDPKYPDRQWVQRTAQKQLKDMAKPLRKKTRIDIPKRLLIRIIGIILIAGFIFGITVVLVDYFIDPAMYDSFNNILYNGSYNETKWGYWTSAGGDAPFVQEDGELIINMGSNLELDVNLKNYQKVILNKPTFIEARVFLDPNVNTSEIIIGFEAHQGNQFEGFSYCNIVNTSNNHSQDIHCGNSYFGENQEVSVNQKLEPTWHLIRIEIDPGKMKITFLVDGISFGPYWLPQPEKLRLDYWRFSPSMHRENLNAPAPVARFDYVRFGSIEDDSASK